MRHSLVNGTMSQFLHVKIVSHYSHINVFYVNVCCSATSLFRNLFQELSYHISRIFFSFSSEYCLPKIGEKFRKVGGNFYHKGYIIGKALFLHKLGFDLPLIFTFYIFGRIQNKQITLIFTNSKFHIPVSLQCKILCWY